MRLSCQPGNPYAERQTQTGSNHACKKKSCIKRSGNWCERSTASRTPTSAGDIEHGNNCSVMNKMFKCFLQSFWAEMVIGATVAEEGGGKEVLAISKTQPHDELRHPKHVLHLKAKRMYPTCWCRQQTSHCAQKTAKHSCGWSTQRLHLLVLSQAFQDQTQRVDLDPTSTRAQRVEGVKGGGGAKGGARFSLFRRKFRSFISLGVSLWHCGRGSRPWPTQSAGSAFSGVILCEPQRPTGPPAHRHNRAPAHWRIGAGCRSPSQSCSFRAHNEPTSPLCRVAKKCARHPP